MSIEALCALLDEFGPGSLTVRTPDGFATRAFVPVVDRMRQELTAVSEADFLRLYGTRSLDAALAFVNETTWSYLSIKGRLCRSPRTEDVAMAWSALAERWFPDGPTQGGTIALQFTPEHAELWNLATNSRRASWSA